MNQRYITEDMLTEFRAFLSADEKSPATITKYMHDVERISLRALNLYCLV